MWEKIKIELKSLWSVLKLAALFGLASDIIYSIIRPEYYSKPELDFPLLYTFVFPFIVVVLLIVWSIVIGLIFPLLLEFLGLIPNWLINITPKWLRRLLNSGTFWIWAWSIGSIILLSLLK